MLCSIARAKIRAWFEAYDKLLSLAILLLYCQVACALIGSLGAYYTGILLVNLAVALFALVAIESGSEKLGRIYAVMLACSLLLDIVWFVLFSVEIRRIKPDTKVGKFSVFSLHLVFWMQSIGFTVRFLSAFLWVQMYRLGASLDQSAFYQPIDFERRIVNFGFTPTSSPRRTTHQSSSLSEEFIGGSIHNPAYYSSLFNPSDEFLSINENGDSCQVASTNTGLAPSAGLEFS